LMVDAGLLVIVSAISPFRAERDAARALFGPGIHRGVRQYTF